MSYSLWQQLKLDAKSLHSCVSFLRSLGFLVLRPGSSIITPSFIRPGSDSKSFAVYDNITIDYVTGNRYDVIDLCALSMFNGNKTQAVEFLAGRKLPHNSSESHSQLFNDQQSKFSQRVDFWHQELLKNPIVAPNGLDVHILDYLQARGISYDVACSLKLGYSPNTHRLMIPFFNRSHQPCYAAGRDMQAPQSSAKTHAPKYSYLKLDDPDFSEILDKCIFGIDSAHPGFIKYDEFHDTELGQIVKLESHHIKYDFLAVCEGMFDVLSFRAEGWGAVSGKLSAAQEPEFLDTCRQYRDKGQKIFICFDSDKAGRNYQRKIALLLFHNKIPFVAGHLPASIIVTRQGRDDFGQEIKIKDVSDYYAAGGSLDQLVRSARDGMEEIANLCQNADELAEIFKESSRCCDRWQIDKLKKAARSVVDIEIETETAEDGSIIRQEVPRRRFDSSAVNFLYAEAMRPLQDCDIAKFVEDKHKLIYDTLGQFYEYRHGVWEAMNDLLIQQEIIRIMHGRISAQKVSGVCKYLKIDLAENVQFNVKHNIVFQNGTLWLDEEGIDFYDDPKNPLHGMPKNFKKSSPDDMSTIQVKYKYDPNARNTVLERAARDWTNNPDGSPNPEKYRLLKQMFGYILFVRNTLQKFFVLKGDGANGKSTCMHCIEAILGKENTTSLQLSRLSSEFDPIMLKHSRVNLCYDAQSSIDAAQEALKALIGGDSITAAHKGVDAESFSTNAKFIVSANKFFSANDLSRGLLRRMLFIAFNNTFTPSAGETSIEDEIMQDLPGLFNFAYEGYKDLKASGYFVETAEQTALLEEFREQLSPLILFAREELYQLENMELADRDVYSLYSSWCKSNGERALGRTKFIPEIRQVIRTDGEIPDPYRDKDTKEWIFRFPLKNPRASVQVEQEDHEEDSERVSDVADRQEVQEVSTSNEPQESTKFEESAPVYTALVHREQAGQKEQEGGAQTAEPRQSRKALQEVAQPAPAKAEQEEPEGEYTAKERQMYMPGTRIRIPDIKHEKFNYDERLASDLFFDLKHKGRNWKERLSGVFLGQYGVGGFDHVIEMPIDEHKLQNLGIYLTLNPRLRKFLPGIEDVLEFGKEC